MTEENIIKKKVDDEWKQKAEQEKIKLSDQENQKEDELELPVPDFMTYISSLSAQALISLGQIENPMTKKKETDVFQAKYIIDLLVLLRDKTRNNLSKEEDASMTQVISSLQLLFVRVSQSVKK